MELDVLLLGSTLTGINRMEARVGDPVDIRRIDLEDSRARERPGR